LQLDSTKFDSDGDEHRALLEALVAATSQPTGGALNYASIAFHVIGAATSHLVAHGHKLVGCSDYAINSHVILDCELPPGQYYVIANARHDSESFGAELELALSCDIESNANEMTTARITVMEEVDAWSHHLASWYLRRVASVAHTPYDVGQNGAAGLSFE
jgi:hypothetical protein